MDTGILKQRLAYNSLSIEIYKVQNLIVIFCDSQTQQKLFIETKFEMGNASAFF